MPVPKPNKGEEQGKFMARCMSDETMKEEYPKSKQRLAVCFSSLRKVRGKGAAPPKESTIRLWHRVRAVIEKVKCPGDKIKSKGRGRGLGIGKKKGPIGRMAKKESLYRVGSIVISEAFVSLRDALEKAVKAAFGKNAWVYDFSNKEVIFTIDDNRVEGERAFQRISYKVTKGEAQFVGSTSLVKRSVSYESSLDAADLVDLADAEMALKEAKNA